MGRDADVSVWQTEISVLVCCQPPPSGVTTVFWVYSFPEVAKSPLTWTRICTGVAQKVLGFSSRQLAVGPLLRGT